MLKTDLEYKYLGSCSVCGSAFMPRNAHILSRRTELSHIYAECTNCRSSAVIFILKNASGFITTIGMLTDMKKDDILRFRKMQPLTADDVLELHQILEAK